MMTRSSELHCIRGCVRPDVHYASCETQNQPGGCGGCAPAPTDRGLVVCDDCRRRIRGVLFQLPDLLGRMGSLASQGAAVVYRPVVVRPAAGLVSAPSPVDDDLADALIAITSNMRAWRRHFDLGSLDGLDRVLSDTAQADLLLSSVLDTNTPTPEGDRSWSVVDALVKWGAERRDPGQRDADRHVFPVADVSVEPERVPIREWNDPLLDVRQAAARVDRSQRAVRRWIQQGRLPVEARVRQGDGTILQAVRASAVDRVAATMAVGRPRTRGEENE